MRDSARVGYEYLLPLTSVLKIKCEPPMNNDTAHTHAPRTHEALRARKGKGAEGQMRTEGRGRGAGQEQAHSE